jgi:hypothetical protein
MKNPRKNTSLLHGHGIAMARANLIEVCLRGSVYESSAIQSLQKAVVELSEGILAEEFHCPRRERAFELALADVLAIMTGRADGTLQEVGQDLLDRLERINEEGEEA